MVGDRWNLLILRELIFGPKRFTDLREALPGIAPNLLTDRLRDLERAELVTRSELPPPAARTVYELTDAGREIRPVLSALARFGATRLAPPEPGRVIRPQAALAAAVTAFHDPLAEPELDEHYRVVIDGTTFDLRVDHGRMRHVPAGSSPAMTLTTDARTLLAVRREGIGLDRIVADGRAELGGRPEALARFARVFSLPTRADSDDVEGYAPAR